MRRALANTSGGVVVFGVKDNVRGRAAAIHGVGSYDPDDWRKTIFSSTTPNIAVELSELSVPDGTTRVLVVRVPRGTQPPYGTSSGIFKRRVGKNCTPMEPPCLSAAQDLARCGGLERAARSRAEAGGSGCG